MQPSNSTLRSGLELKSGLWTDTHAHIFLVTLFTAAKRQKQHKYPLIWCGIIYTIEYYSVMKKEWSSDTCYDIEKLWKHYAKWDKPDTRGKMLYNFTYKK